jgi:hypothetical protein
MVDARHHCELAVFQRKALAWTVVDHPCGEAPKRPLDRLQRVRNRQEFRDVGLGEKERQEASVCG